MKKNGVRAVEEATEKQIIALKRFAKNPELSKSILKGKQFDELSKKEASELIKKCYDHENGVTDENGDLNDTSDDDPVKSGDFRIKFSQNYRNGDGSFKTTILSDEELAEIRDAHRRHCEQVMEECSEDYSDDRELQLAMFDKRADKVFTWIQQALDEKVRRQRGVNNGNQY